MLLALLLPVRVELRLSGDLRAGVTISVAYRVLGLIAGTRVLHAAPGAVPIESAAPARDGPARHEDIATDPDHLPATSARAADTSRAQRLRELWSKLELAQRALQSGAIRIVRPAGWIEFALDDVAETGRLYGVACAIGPLLDPEGELEILPCWSAEEWLAADLMLRGRVYPLRLGLVLARAGFARRALRRASATSRAAESHAVA